MENESEKDPRVNPLPWESEHKIPRLSSNSKRLEVLASKLEHVVKKAIQEPQNAQSPEVPKHTSGPVENFLDRFATVQNQTAEDCQRTADWLEQAAADLRNRATILMNQARQIPEDLRASVDYEIQARRQNAFLSSLKKDLLKKDTGDAGDSR